MCLATAEDDYLLQMMDVFLATGTVFLARIGDQPAGVVKVDRALDGSSWLSALRVVPSFRRQGLGAALCHACDAAGAQWGSTAIRLWTGARNLEANGVFASVGYHRVGLFTRWWGEVEPDRRDLPERPASAGEVLTRARTAAVYEASRGYVPLRLRFCRLSEPLLEDLHQADRLYLDAKGRPCVLDPEIWRDFERDVVELTVLGDDLSAQVGAASRLGAASGMVSVGAYLPYEPPWPTRAARAGLTMGTWGTRAVLYEKRLVPADGTVIRS